MLNLMYYVKIKTLIRKTVYLRIFEKKNLFLYEKILEIKRAIVNKIPQQSASGYRRCHTLNKSCSRFESRIPKLR